MHRPMRAMLLAACLFLLIACQSQEAPPIPTLFDLNAAATSDTATAAVNATLAAPTITATRSAPTLPPTFTDTVEPTITPTSPAAAPTQTPEGFNAAGIIYYIYNGDSIAALSGDGTSEELILIGGPYSDLTVSPDGQLLTYVAPGAGSAREVFVSSRDGTYTQQISCLGFANVSQPVWTPDNRSITFVASPAVGAAGDIYIADFAGANNCPQGNNQRKLVNLASTRVRDPAWNNTGDKFFFSDSYIFGLELADNLTYPLTTPSGFGPDFGLIHSPTGKKLAYLRTELDQQTGQIGGRLFIIDTSSIRQPPRPQMGGNFLAEEIRWSRDGRLILIGAPNAVLVYDAEFGTSSKVIENLRFSPQPVFDPDAERVAYVNAGVNNPAVQQIFTISRQGGVSQQITTHAEGTIEDLLWLSAD